MSSKKETHLSRLVMPLITTHGSTDKFKNADTRHEMHEYSKVYLVYAQTNDVIVSIDHNIVLACRLALKAKI